ncbi:MAG: hypothetical protein ABFD83_10105 [Armatimonadota bacterium]
MKCTDAREIIQNLMDGDQCPNARLAQEHIAECADCREWKSGIDTVIAMASEVIEDIPDIDISAAVMTRLPKRHPASVSWSLQRLVALSAACWFAGAAVLAAALSILMTATNTPFASLPTIAYGSAKSLVSSILVIVSTMGTLIRPIADMTIAVLPGIRDFVITIKPLILLAIATDIGLLITGCLMWQQRKTTTLRFLI